MGAEPQDVEVAIFTMDGVWTHDLANALQVFGAPRGDGKPEVAHIELVSGNDFVSLDHGLSARTVPFSTYEADSDIVIIPGFQDPVAMAAHLATCDSRGCEQEGKLWLQRMHANGAAIGAMGSAPLILAWTGLLDSAYYTACRLWRDCIEDTCDRLGLRPRARYDQLVVHDGGRNLWTCAGGVSGLDMCLNILAATAGAARAHEAANDARLWLPCPPGTRQDALGFRGKSGAEVSRSEIESLIDEVRRHPDRSWTIDDMAWYCGMSSRTFQCHFHRVLGQTPVRWLIAERLSIACDYLEKTDLSLAYIAQRVGMGSADLLRKNFSRAYGESPSLYRKRLNRK